MSDASTLWNRIVSLEGQIFRTKTGLPFTFRVGPGHIVPIRDGRELNRDASYAEGPAPWDLVRPQPAIVRLAAEGGFAG